MNEYVEPEKAETTDQNNIETKIFEMSFENQYRIDKKNIDYLLNELKTKIDCVDVELKETKLVLSEFIGKSRNIDGNRIDSLEKKIVQLISVITDPKE